jgi:hypothetical protein
VRVTRGGTLRPLASFGGGQAAGPAPA